MKTLFICKGNVGRSQMAEALFRKIHGDGSEVASAGTKLSGPEQPIGELMPQIQEVLEVMKEEGMDVSHAVRKQLTEAMVDEADRIVAILEDEDPLPDFLEGSFKLVRWSISDPKGKDLAFTRTVKDQIKAKIARL